MKFFVALLLLAVICFGNESKADFFQMTPIVILQKSLGDKRAPAIPKATQCGGQGELVAVRCAECKIVNNTCNLKVLEQVNGEIDFIPATDTKALKLTIEIGYGNEKPTVAWEGAILNSEVRKNLLYTASITTVLNSNVQGRKIKTRYIIADSNSGATRLCMSTEAILN